MATHSSSEFSARTRIDNLKSLTGDLFDILIVGGGITGAGIARDAAMRGYRVALIDKGDFASGTSSKSSKLVHGGVRYMELFEFGLVAEASRERRTLWEIAPHLVHPLPFIFPVYRDARWAPWMIDVGMWMYDALAMFRNFKRHQMLSTKQVGQMMKGIDTRDIFGAAYYYDAQVDDARLTLETIRAAHHQGAVIANYVQVDNLLKEKGRVAGAELHDVISGEKISAHARVVVNATGPWTDTLIQFDEPRAPKRMRPNKGIHIIVPREKFGGKIGASMRGAQEISSKLISPHIDAPAATFPSFSDGRIMFVIPWGAFTIIGTTESDYDEDFDRVHANVVDVEYVLAAANHAFPGTPLQKSDVISAYAGLRPLVIEQGKDAHKTSREHQIWSSETGLVTIAGGKLTTYRSMAQELVDLVAKQLHDEFDVAPAHRCATNRTPLIADGQVTQDSEGIAENTLAHLVRTHGPETTRVLEIAKREPRMMQPLVEELPYIWAEVEYALENEMAMTVNDLLARRLHILLEARDNGLRVAPEVAARMGKYLGWDKARIEKELHAYEEQVKLVVKFR